MAKDIYAILAQRIRHEKIESGLTIDELAEKAGISSRFLACLIVNKRKPSVETVAKIADALHVPAYTLFQDVSNKSTAEDKRITETISRLVLSAKPANRKILLSMLEELSKKSFY